MIVREWKVGVDLSICDAILDEITFEDLILTVHCNCREITPSAVQNELNDILQIRLDDMWDLLQRNMDTIMAEAAKDR